MVYLKVSFTLLIAMLVTAGFMLLSINSKYIFKCAEFVVFVETLACAVFAILSIWTC